MVVLVLSDDSCSRNSSQLVGRVLVLVLVVTGSSVTLTPSAFLLLPLFPPERGMTTNRNRSSKVRKNGTKAEKRSGAIAGREQNRTRQNRTGSAPQLGAVRLPVGRSLGVEAKFRSNLR